MLVRKLKCPSCGSSKVTEVKTGYVFCDYCAEFIGFDFVKIEDESKSVFNMDYYLEHSAWPPETQEYLSVVQKLGAVIAARDETEYVEIALKQMELQAKLMPGTFSPKMKVEGFRKKFLAYYREFLKDRIADHLFEEQEQFNASLAPLMADISMELVEGKYLWKLDEKAMAYFDKIFAYSQSLSEKTIRYPSASLYPEPISDTSKDLFLKQTMSAYCNTLTEEDFTKLAKHYGFDNEYVEIPDVDISKVTCACCNSLLEVPTGAKFVICETCGNKIDPEKRLVSCQNCGSSFSPTGGRESKCDYCGSRVQLM